MDTSCRCQNQQPTNKYTFKYQQPIAHAKIYVMSYAVWILPADVRTNNIILYYIMWYLVVSGSDIGRKCPYSITRNVCFSVRGHYIILYYITLHYNNAHTKTHDTAHTVCKILPTSEPLSMNYHSWEYNMLWYSIIVV